MILTQVLGADSNWSKPIRTILLPCQNDWFRYPRESQLMCDILLVNKIGLELYLSHWVSTSGLLRVSWNKMHTLFLKKQPKEIIILPFWMLWWMNVIDDWNCYSYVATKKDNLKIQLASWIRGWNKVHIFNAIVDQLTQIKTRSILSRDF